MTFSIDTKSETIRFTTTRDVEGGEELCFFYGHRLWFTPSGSAPRSRHGVNAHIDSETEEGCWKDFCELLAEEENVLDTNPFSSGDPDDAVPEEELPFWRTRVTATDDEEDQEDSVRTGMRATNTY